jgi:A/G-specific adenine glycosylase
VLLARDAQGRVWLEKRPSKGIWAGLYCLPVFDSREDLLAALPTAARRGVQDLPAFVHVLTHKDLHLHPVQLQGGQPQGDGARWVEAEEWGRLGLPAPMRKLLEGSEA